MAQRQRAGLITPRTLDRNELPVFYIRRFTRTYHAVNTATKPIHRHGAEAARGAHNSEVTRSKRVAGILLFAGLQEPTTLSIQQQNIFTGMAQRQRAGLITPRTLDRNELPVFYIRLLYRSRPSLLCDVKHCFSEWCEPALTLV